MAKHHLKQLIIPKTWALPRKANTFILRPRPGAHTRELSIPLGVILRDILKLGKTMREIRFILRNKEVLVDGKKRTDPKLPVGFMDVLSIPELQQHYRLSLNDKGRLVLVPIQQSEANLKLCRIIGKKLLQGGAMQINLSDAKNPILKKKEQHREYKLGDALLLTLPQQEIREHILLKRGSAIMLIGGKHIGTIGTIQDIQGTVLKYTLGKETFETLRQYAFAMGKEKPIIQVTKHA